MSSSDDGRREIRVSIVCCICVLPSVVIIRGYVLAEYIVYKVVKYVEIIYF